MRIRKGIFYFQTYSDAIRYAKDNAWPTDRIIGYEMGHAIQLGVSGDYVGPNTVHK